MRLAALLLSFVQLAIYAMLVHRDPTYAWLSPRGGIAMLGVALAIGNVLVWLSGQPHRSLEQRFQFGAAGWIWLVAQGVALCIELSNAPEVG